MRFGWCGAPRAWRFRRATLARLTVVCLAAGACGGTPAPVLQPARPAAPTPTDPSAAAVAVQPEAPAPAQTASVTGRVVTTAEGAAPIARARVILTSEALSEPRVAITNADGSFRFEKLPSGAYALSASASGFAQVDLQQTTDVPPITLAEGQRREGLEIALPPAGVIVGRILDEDDRPFVGAMVNALISRVVNGQSRLLSMSSATSDDRGRFRLAGLPAGQYYVSAFDPAFIKVGDDTGQLRYTATYYPGVLFVEQASRVGVTPGVEPDVEIVLKLQIVRPARVSGSIAVHDKRQLSSGAVLLVPIHAEGLSAVAAGEGELLPNGRFIFRNVPPGNYQIRARAEIGSLEVSLFATYRLRVHGRDIANIAMELLPGASLRGTVAYQPVHTPAPPTFKGMRVRAPFADGTSFGDAVTGYVGDDGRYHIRGVMMGSHVVTVEGVPEPWVLKAVVWQGRDITDAAIEVDARERLEGVRVTLTDAASEIRGLVRDQRGRPVPGALVLMIPSSSQFWTRTSRRFGVLHTSDDGTYRLRGLPAGEYHAVATVEFDESEIYRKELVRDFAAAGRPLALHELQTVVLDLSLTSLAPVSRTLAR